MARLHRKMVSLHRGDGDERLRGEALWVSLTKLPDRIVMQGVGKEERYKMRYANGAAFHGAA